MNIATGRSWQLLTLPLSALGHAIPVDSPQYWLTAHLLRDFLGPLGNVVCWQRLMCLIIGLSPLDMGPPWLEYLGDENDTVGPEGRPENL